MIAFLDGTVESIEDDGVVLAVGGVGYRVLVPLTVSQSIAVGVTCRLYTHQHVREDILALFGFLTDAERRLFLRLQSASGVGPKLALQIMSHLAAGDVVRALRSGDAVQMTQVPGVGAKTAQRLVVELKDRLDDLSASFVPSMTQAQRSDLGGMTAPGVTGSDLEEALYSLGYTEREVKPALLAIEGQTADLDLSKAIKLALRHLSH